MKIDKGYNTIKKIEKIRAAEKARQTIIIAKIFRNLSLRHGQIQNLT